MRRLITVLLILYCQPSAYAESFNTLQLHNDKLKIIVTPQLGGRVIDFHLTGHDNFLKIGSPYIQGTQPDVSASANNIDYFGHIVWVGPQSQWWRKQQLNKQRYQDSAIWPPDPYLIFAQNKVKALSKTTISLQGATSPISGMQLNKTFSLDPVVANKVNLSVEGINISQTPQSWDLWFNTRVSSDTQIVVPVTHRQDIRLESFEDAQSGPINVQYSDQYMLLNSATFARNKIQNKGKVFIQPRQGWMAGFRNGQLFMIQFPLVSADKIHPEQGQIEIYAHYHAEETEAGVIEMEFHTPYLTLDPGQTALATASWYLFVYPEHFSHQQILALLQEKLSTIVLPSTPYTN